MLNINDSFQYTKEISEIPPISFKCKMHGVCLLSEYALALPDKSVQRLILKLIYYVNFLLHIKTQ